VESVPGRSNGAWVFRDTRLPVSAVFENLEAGATVDQITDWLDIAKDQVIEVLEFAARSVAAPVAIDGTPSEFDRPQNRFAGTEYAAMATGPTARRRDYGGAQFGQARQLR
jgi:uncharacterized protein (DUF433 family)